MNNMNKTLMELHGMLRLADASMSKTQVSLVSTGLAIRENGYNGKGNAKVVQNNKCLKRNGGHLT